MSIFRRAEKPRFVTIDKQCLEDKRLSYQEIGLLCYLLSKPDTWEVRTRELIAAHTNGRDAVYAILTDLITHGYIEKGGMLSDENGKFSGYEYTVHEYPCAAPPSAEQEQESAPYTANPYTVIPYTEKPHLSSYKGIEIYKDSEVLEINSNTYAHASVNEISVQNQATPIVVTPFAASPDIAAALAEAEQAGASILAARTATPYSDAFEQFWALYGRKGNKYRAYQYWRSEHCEGICVAVIFGVRRYLASSRAVNGYKQDAERWLHEHGWESEWSDVTRRAAPVPTESMPDSPLYAQTPAEQAWDAATERERAAFGGWHGFIAHYREHHPEPEE